MTEILTGSSLLILFIVTALGYAAGRVKLFGVRLGSAAILFVGLFIGVFIDFNMPMFPIELGLVLFVYTIGLSNGASFFSALRREGRQQISFIIFSLTIPLVMVLGLFFLLNLDVVAALPVFSKFNLDIAASAPGLFAGVGTNTAAFATVLEAINTTADNPMAADITLVYAIAYPVGVLGRILTFTLFQRWWHIDYAAEAEAWRTVYPGGQELINQAIKITEEAVTGKMLRDLQREHPYWDVLFGRLWHDGEVALVNGDSKFALGDLIFVAGEPNKIARLAEDLGEITEDTVFADYSVYAKRRFFVSNPAIVGQTIASLDLKERFGAQITRVRRGDSDVLPNRDTILELGDRVRLLFRRTDLPELNQLFGDSYVAVSQVNLLSLGVGVTLGLLLGTVAIELPGDIRFEIGFAAGTLIVGLILGAVRRTGSIVWTLPYSTNQTLQQFGLILLLSGIGIRSGNALELSDLGQPVLVLALFAVLTVLITNALALFVGYKILKMPFALLTGMLSLQPAVFHYVSEEAKNHLPTIGFTIGIPLALILNVIYAQFLYLLFLTF